jgi:cell wall-associated NlpC family hydrolase
MAGFNGWTVGLAGALGIPLTQQNIKFLSAWQQAEGGSASYNPLNTTQPANGATAYNSNGGNPVKNYLSPQQGIRATAQTLANGHYDNLLGMLRSGKATAAQLASQPDLHVWGTGSGVLRVLGSSPVAGGKAQTPFAGSVTPPAPTGPNPLALALLQQSGETAAGAAPNMGALLQFAMQRQQSGAAQDVYGPQGANGGLTGAGKGVNLVRTAETQLGQPYQWGGRAQLGAHTDCSGLVQAVMAKNGISIPRTTFDQWRVGQPVPPNALKPGDAVFFKGSDGRDGLPGHVGLYVGGGRFIEDPHTGATVRISNLSQYPGYMGARRYGG